MCSYKAAFTRAMLRVGGPLHLTAERKKPLGGELLNEEPCKIRHLWQHLTHQVIVTRML